MVSLVLLLAAAATPQAPSLSKFGWLSGTWYSESDGVRAEATWSPFDADLATGFTRRVQGGKVVFCELRRIVRTDAEITFQAWQAYGDALQGGGKFKLIRHSASELVFEYPTNPFPRLIIFRKEGEGGMLSRIEGTVDGKETARNIHWKRQASPKNPSPLGEGP
jgi:hypothetical protein